MNADRALAIAGVLLGIPGVVVLLLTANQTLAIFAGLLAVLLLSTAYYANRLIGAPPFTFSSVEMTLEFIGDHKTAILTKIYKIKPNHSHLTQLEHKNIAADGDITDFAWNDSPIPSWAITKSMGEYELRIDLPVVPAMWKNFDGKLSYRLIDSFNLADESMTYCVDFPTKKVKIVIILPQGKPCTSTAARKHQGAGQVPMQDPISSNNGRRIEAIIKKPIYGANYTIHWHW